MASDLTPFLSQTTDRSRASYFTHKEKLIILENFENYKDVFKTKANTAVASKAREECWKKIAECVNTSGSSNVPRTWRQIKTKYKNLLQSAHRRRKRQIQEANQTNQEAQILEALRGGVQSNPAFHGPQEHFVQVEGNTMVVVEPHNLVSPETETGTIFKTLFPEIPPGEAKNIQTSNLPEASTPRSEEELVETESLRALQKKSIELDNIKKELEIHKLRLEIEKLEYEKKKDGYGNNKKDACQPAMTRQSTTDNDEISQPNKLNGSVADFQNLHRELLLGHKRGLLFGVKPELKRVLEQRRGRIHKEEEQARLGPSDLETELRKRQQKLKEYELEELRQRENLEKIPEFVRVKDNLRRTQMLDQ